MTKQNTHAMVLALLTLCAFPPVASAITSEELKALDSAKEKVTVIDVRSSALYQCSHIPNAIHVPEEILAAKPLPELGRVIVVTDGLDPDFDAKAVAALNAKPGIRAELLDGGMARWDALGEATTEPAGLAAGDEASIGYARLKRIAAKSRHLVLVDIRGNPESAAKRARLEPTAEPEARPGPASVERAPPATTQVVRGRRGGEAGGAGGRELLLIDDGTGLAGDALAQLGGEETSRKELAAAEAAKEIESASREVDVLDLRALGDTTRALAPLAEDFPGARTLRASFLWAVAGAEREKLTLAFAAGLDLSQRTTYVLVDDGFGDARQVMDLLRAAGIRNCLTLLGGDEVLKRDGKSERRVTQ